MSWQNPLAWIGLSTIVLPIVIHLLGQQRARRVLFPSLRFVGESRPLPTRRTRLHDLLLLALRIGVLVAAVTGLAAPRFAARAGLTAADHTLVRAVIIDQGASMSRRSSSGESAMTVAQRTAAAIADSAQRHVLLVAANPPDAITGAVEWLQRQSGRAELVIVSDFQAGLLDRADLAAIPTRIGVKLIRIAIPATTEPVVVRSRLGSNELLATTTALPDGNGIEWRSGGAAAPAPARLFTLAGPSEAVDAGASAQAAQSAATRLPLDTLHAMSVVYPQAAERGSLLRQGRSVHSAWIAELIARLRGDPLLIAAAATAGPVDSAGSRNAVVVARTRDGSPAVLATEATRHGTDQLVLAPLTEAGSLTATALLVAATRSLSLAAPTAELEPRTIADSALAQWQRPIGSANATGSDASDGRWLWGAALVLLGAEWLLRRRMAPPAGLTAA